MYVDRVTFHLDPADRAALDALAERYRVPLAHLCRAAVRLFLAHPEHHAPLTEYVRAHYPPPTPAAVRYCEECPDVDLEAIAASLTHGHE